MAHALAWVAGVLASYVGCWMLHGPGRVLERTVVLLRTTTALVHEFQTERGLSAAYIASGGSLFSMSAGWFHTCFVYAGIVGSSGGVACMGSNSDGQLGTGNLVAVHRVNEPLKVGGQFADLAAKSGQFTFTRCTKCFAA